MQDVITISNLSDAVYEDKKFIYVIGMTNDNVPANFKLSGLINSDDVSKDNLIEKTDEHYNKEYYSFLKAIKNKNVIITYHKLGTDLKLKTPSVYFDKLSKKEVVHDKLYNKDLLLNNYALMLSFDKIEKIKDESFGKINDSNNHNLNYKISKETALKLYGTKLNLSPSKVEVYAKCPFYFFCEYGLKLNIKERYTFDNRETGSLVHYVLEKIISSNLDEIDLDNLENYVNKYAFLYLEENGKIINNTIKFVVKEVSKSTALIIKNIIKEQEISKFRPKYFEFRVGEESVVKPVTVNMGDALISVSGIVDRLDVYEDDETYYYRIIDYKTGEKKFRLDDILDGLNLQMLLYLLAIKESSKNITNKKVMPSALLYYPALVKESLSSRSLTKEEEENNVKDKLKMNGMICNDKIVIEALGGDVIGDFISVTTRGKINEEKVFGLDDLCLIFKSIKGTLKNISKEILNGNIKVNPIGGRNDACSFCKFNSICKFDTMLDKKEKSADLKNSEVIKKIEGDYHA